MSAPDFECCVQYVTFRHPELHVAMDEAADWLRTEKEDEEPVVITCNWRETPHPPEWCVSFATENFIPGGYKKNLWDLAELRSSVEYRERQRAQKKKMVHGAEVAIAKEYCAEMRAKLTPEEREELGL